MSRAAFFDEVRAAVERAIGPDDRPVVAYAATWPFFRELKSADDEIVDQLLGIIASAVATRTLLMPTFCGGYSDGRCDLDAAVSITGVLSERLRLRPDARRTLSAFFSFAAVGARAGEVADLAPADAWGEGSLYEWMEQSNVRFLMFGTHSTQSSYLHRAEWLCRDRIRYRYPKAFHGTLVRGGNELPMTERLFVRSLAPPVDNDFTVLGPLLQDAGLTACVVRGISITGYDAAPALHAAVGAIERDPLLLVRNRADFA